MPKATELSHYGVRGMRWGVRKDNTSPSAVAQRNDEEKGKLAPSLSGHASFAVSNMDHGISQMRLTGDDLTVDRSKGYADIRTASFPENDGAAKRHAEIIATLDEMRAKYPAVAAMKIEVVPMSRVPYSAHEVSASFASVQGVKKGEARIMYNDKLDKLEPYQQEFVQQYMPGVATKNYVGYHEMGHLLAVAHGTFPPSYDAMASGFSSRSVNKYDKQNQKRHKTVLKQHGLAFKRVKHISPYAATAPSEALAEVVGHALSPELRQRLDPDTRRKADALINEMGGV
jgi:hypothetical protein